MANISIVNPDGSKTAVTKDQLVALVQSGRLTSESKIEVLGRVVPVSKVRELRQYLTPVEEAAPEPTPPPQAAEVAQEVFAPLEEPPAQKPENELNSAVPHVMEIPPTTTSVDVPPNDFSTSNTPPLPVPISMENQQEVFSFVSTSHIKMLAMKRVGSVRLFYWACIWTLSLYLVYQGYYYVDIWLNASKEHEELAFLSLKIGCIYYFSAFSLNVLAFCLYRFVLLLNENVIRREMGQAEQMRIQAELVDVMKSKTY